MVPTNDLRSLSLSLQHVIRSSSMERSTRTMPYPTCTSIPQAAHIPFPILPRCQFPSLSTMQTTPNHHPSTCDVVADASSMASLSNRRTLMLTTPGQRRLGSDRCGMTNGASSRRFRGGDCRRRGMGGPSVVRSLLCDGSTVRRGIWRAVSVGDGVLCVGVAMELKDRRSLRSAGSATLHRCPLRLAICSYCFCRRLWRL
mmetsp:Transcript_19707/g.54808  ORF Transcript_19707/g.54808 Transcript_19707/m.54808 type:complete len:200 (+) Transcript_19707:142-741(+)